MSLLSKASPLDGTKPSDYLFRGLFLGNSGAGKTELACSIKGEKPLLLLDFDGRAATIAGRQDIHVLTEPFRGGDPTSDPIRAIEKVMTELEGFDKEDMPYRGVVFDGFTSLTRLAMRFSMRMGGKKDWSGLPPKQGERRMLPYEEAKNICEQIVLASLALPCHVIWTGHFAVLFDYGNTGTGKQPTQWNKAPAYDPNSGEAGVTPRLFPLLIGQQRTSFPALFNECWQVYRSEGKHWIRFTGSDMFDVFKSSLNQRGEYWNEVEEFDIKSQPCGIELFLEKRFK